MTAGRQGKPACFVPVCVWFGSLKAFSLVMLFMVGKAPEIPPGLATLEIPMGTAPGTCKRIRMQEFSRAHPGRGLGDWPYERPA